ncbi:MAG: type II toxin-antitoxin system VapB family antitoxin [Agriterribacter sp.]
MKGDLIKKIESLPEDFQKEVEHFVDFLKIKASEETVPLKTRKAGFAKGMFVMKDGFDDPLEDFKDYQ